MKRIARQFQPTRAGLLLWLFAAASACKSGSSPPLSHTQSEAPAPDIPVPPADGPQLLALRSGTAILERPAADAAPIGELRLGALIARSPEPVSRNGCPGGFYAVRPKGFVCAGDAATVQVALGHALPAAPDLSKPLPYRYGRARAENVPLYTRLPTLPEQVSEEPDLKKIQAKNAQTDARRLGAAANDVPLDPRGVPTGPPVLMPGIDGVAGDARRTVASFFSFPSPAIPALLPVAWTADGAKGDALRKGSGVAIASTWTVDLGYGPRVFGVTAGGAVVPTDRLRPALGTRYHGIDLEKTGLPAAFVHKFDVHTWMLTRGSATEQDEELERRTAVALTGRFRTIDGIRYEEARDGYWLRTQDLVMVIRRHKFPEFVNGNQKWLDVSLANQTVTAYEGTKPVYATLISSGRDRLGDSAESASTVRGTFHIRSKHVSRAIDTREVHGDFDVADAPWVMEFEPGYAFTGKYWGDGLGEAQGFHNVALSPIDARRLWLWADPPVPEGWHGVFDTKGEGTIVYVRA